MRKKIGLTLTVGVGLATGLMFTTLRAQFPPTDDDPCTGSFYCTMDGIVCRSDSGAQCLVDAGCIRAPGPGPG